ncbi:MAG: amino acid adenylation domain-containing protein [Aestuariibacter sp.]
MNVTQVAATQQDIFYEQQKDVNSPKFNVGGYIELRNVHIQHLIKAHRELLKNHPEFSLKFRQFQGQVQQYHDVIEFPALEIIDFSREPAPEQSAQYWLKEIFSKPFSLDRGCLFNAYCVKLSENLAWYVGIAHHIIVDGYGFFSWAKHLANYYNNPDQGQTSTKYSVAERIKNQITYQQTDRYRKAGEFWREYIKEIPPSPLTVKTNQGGESAPGDRLTRDFPEKQYRMTQAQLTTQGLDAAPFFLTLFQAVLYKKFATRKNIFGIPTHNRQGRSEKSMLYACANVFPVSVNLQPELTLKENARLLAVDLKKCYRYSRIANSEILRIFNANSDKKVQALSHLQFNYLMSDESLLFGNTTAQLSYVSNRHESVPLSLTIWQSAGKVQLHIDYQFSCLSTAEVESLYKDFMLLLEKWLTAPHTPLNQYNLLTEKDKNTISSWANGAPLKPHIHENVYELFVEQVSRTPENTAISCQGERLCYRELNEKVDIFAQQLLQAEIQSGDLVGVCLQRTPEMLASLLAIFKIGGAYVPLDHKYPVSRIRTLLRVSDTQKIITDSHTETLFDDDEFTLIQLGESQPYSKQTYPFRRVRDQISHIIFTSGSTGVPKGVQITNDNVLALLQWSKLAFTYEEVANVAATTSICFDLSVFEFWGPLVRGGQITLFEDGLSLAKASTEGLTLINTVPSVGKALLECDFNWPDSLKVLNLAGEALSSLLLNQLLQTSIPKVNNLYGPSEDTTYSTWVGFTEAVSQTPTIGKPIAGTRAYVLDQDGQLAGLGAIGELFLTGAGVSAGYLNSEAVHNEKFRGVPDIGEEYGYFTGDLVKWNNCGELEYYGRNDSQIKLRGFRIELQEIEDALCKLSFIDDAIVSIQTHNQIDHLTAFYTSSVETQTSESLEKLAEEALTQKLPNYMVPTLWQQLPEIMLNLNGKKDRSQLPTVAPKSTLLNREKTETESKLLAIVTELLHYQKDISPEANLFELGGDSPTALRLCYEVEKAFAVDIQLADLFKQPDFASLALFIEQGQQQANIPDIPKTPLDGNHPLSLEQEQIWLADMVAGKHSAYNMPAYLILPQNMDINRLELAINEILKRHTILRTRYHTQNGEVQQSIVPFQPLELPTKRIDSFETLQQIDWVQHFLTQPFDLANENSIRCQLLVDDYQNKTLLIVLHHIATDAKSVGILLEQIFHYYQNTNTVSITDDLQYLHFSQWQVPYINARQSSLLSYWQAKLRDAPYFHQLPLDGKRTGSRGQPLLFRQHLTDTQFAKVTRLASDHKCTPVAVLQASLAILINRISNDKDIVTGLVLDGRRHPETKNTVGCFVNIVPIRTTLNENNSFVGLLEQTNENCAEAHQFGELPLKHLVEALDIQPLEGISPIFQIIVNYEDRTQRSQKLASAGVQLQSCQPTKSKYDFEFSLVKDGAQHHIEWVYDSALFNQLTITQYANSLENLIEQVYQAPQSTIRQILATPTQHFDTSNVNSSASAHSNIANVFESLCLTQPNRTAIQCGEASYKFSTMQQCVARVLTLLETECHEPHKPLNIGLCCTSPWLRLIFSMAIIRAGATAILFDKRLKSSDIAAICEVSDIKLILSEADCGQQLPDSIQVVTWQGISQMAIANRIQRPVQDNSIAYSAISLSEEGQPVSVEISHAHLLNYCQRSPFSNSDIVLIEKSCAQVSLFEQFQALLKGAMLVFEQDSGSACGELQDLVNDWKATALFTNSEKVSPFLDVAELSSSLDIICFGNRPTTLHNAPVKTLTQMFINTALSLPVAMANLLSDRGGNSELHLSPHPIHPAIQLINQQGHTTVPGGLGRVNIPARELSDVKSKNQTFISDGLVGRLLTEEHITYQYHEDKLAKIGNNPLYLDKLESFLESFSGVINAKCAMTNSLDIQLQLIDHTEPTTIIKNLKKALESHFPLTNTQIKYYVKLKDQYQHVPISIDLVSDVGTGNESEYQLLLVWQEILGVSGISATDNFFKLGGNSILAIKLITKIQRVFDLEVSVDEVFKHPTFEEQLEKILGLQFGNAQHNNHSSEMDDEATLIL